MEFKAKDAKTLNWWLERQIPLLMDQKLEDLTKQATSMIEQRVAMTTKSKVVVAHTSGKAVITCMSSKDKADKDRQTVNSVKDLLLKKY